MTFEEYQNFAKQNHRPGCDEIVFALGLGGESGEVLEVIKKARRDLKPIDKEHLKEELGDVLWYVANLCTVYGFTLAEVIEGNVLKLCDRYNNTDISVAYRRNGPHIEKYDPRTGKHIKFCKPSEVPTSVLRALNEMQASEESIKKLQALSIAAHDDDCPF